jgi:hypothetical protein
VSVLAGSTFKPDSAVQVDATVWCFNESDDVLYVYQADDASSIFPFWNYKGTDTCEGKGVGLQTLSVSFALGSVAGDQAIRVAFTYDSPEASCDVGDYNDRDDVVLHVVETTDTCDLTILDIVPVAFLPGGTINLFEGNTLTFTATCMYTGAGCGTLSDDCTQAGGVDWSGFGDISLSTPGPSTSTIATAGQILGPAGGSGQVSGLAAYGSGAYSDNTDIMVINDDVVVSTDITPLNPSITEGGSEGFQVLVTWDDGYTLQVACDAGTTWQVTGDLTLGSCDGDTQAVNASQVSCGAGGSGTVNVTYSSTGTVSGYIRDQVTLYGIFGASFKVRYAAGDSVVTTTGAGGYYLLSNVRTGTNRTCLASKSGYNDNNQLCNIITNTTVNMNLVPKSSTGTLLGWVRDAGGNAMGGANLLISGAPSVTQVDGFYSMRLAVGANHTLRASAPGYLDDYYSGLVISDGGTTQQDATLLLVNGDPDRDGLTNDQEVNTYLTNPLLADTDHDGLPDGWEVCYLDCVNPLVADASVDADGDGLSNLAEYTGATDPCVP